MAGAKRKAGSPNGPSAGQDEGRITSGNAYMLLYRRVGEASLQQDRPCELPERYGAISRSWQSFGPAHACSCLHACTVHWISHASWPCKVAGAHQTALSDLWAAAPTSSMGLHGHCSVEHCC